MHNLSSQWHCLHHLLSLFVSWNFSGRLHFLSYGCIPWHFYLFFFVDASSCSSAWYCLHNVLTSYRFLWNYSFGIFRIPEVFLLLPQGFHRCLLNLMIVVLQLIFLLIMERWIKVLKMLNWNVHFAIWMFCLSTYFPFVSFKFISCLTLGFES